MKTRTVSLRSVSMKDRRFSFSRGSVSSDITESISRHGLFDAPTLWKEGRRLSIVSGRHRLKAVIALGWPRVPARIVTEEEITPFEAWSMNFHTTLSVRKLNGAEKCTLLRQLIDFGVEPALIVGDYLPLLELAPTPKVLKECLAVSSLGEKHLDTLSEARITLSTAVFLSGLDDRVRRAAFRFLTKYPLSFSQQREWIRLVTDICRRDGRDLPGLLSSALRSARKSTGHPGPAVLDVLRKRRYPVLSSRSLAFRSATARLGLPPSFRIDPHPSFEKDDLSFSFKARSNEEIRRAIEILDRCLNTPLFPTGDRPRSRKK